MRWRPRTETLRFPGWLGHTRRFDRVVDGPFFRHRVVGVGALGNRHRHTSVDRLRVVEDNSGFSKVVMYVCRPAALVSENYMALAPG